MMIPKHPLVWVRLVWFSLAMLLYSSAGFTVDFLRAKDDLVINVRSYDDDDEKEASKSRSERYVPFLQGNPTTKQQC